MKLIVVESPTKAKALNSYLKNESIEYKVVASYGHVRALAKTKGSVDVENDFAMNWENVSKSSKAAKEIISIAKKSDEVILATDPDREGEAIAWHLAQMMGSGKVKAKLSRMRFHSITPKSIKESLDKLEDIDQDLVDAYMARLGLDYLVGFNISPVLWRKLPGSKSAGRVQSSALRIITDREYEIESFVSEDYWTLHAKFSQNQYSCTADLHEWEGKKIDKFMWTSESVDSAKNELLKSDYQISNFEFKDQLRNPSAPFITSTLQQEAANKLGWKPMFSMKIAQKLYEGVKLSNGMEGLITYMRTDSVNISQSGVDECRAMIENEFGSTYLPKKQNFYKSKVRNAQEAHEAIRPTNFNHLPEQVKPYLNEEEFKLYNLIWKRSVASQMASAIYEICNMFISGEKGTWKAHGVKSKFDGFQKLYSIDKLENEDIWSFNKDTIKCDEVVDEKHQTKPPSRFTETSLIKYMEDKGIGRPSTYANILFVLDKRGYVFQNKKSIIPSNLGWIVSAFLKNYFEIYVQDEFTSGMEDKLDLVSKGEKNWKELLQDFWVNFKSKIDDAYNLDMKDILKRISQTYKEHFFKKTDAKCPKCKGDQELRISKGSGFLCCSNYPSCNWNKSIDSELDQDLTLGEDPDSGDEILVKQGPYGYYIQWGKAEVKARVMLPAMFAPPHNLTVEDALKIKSLPIIIGRHPSNGEIIKIGIGRFGPWILYKNTYVSLKKSPFETTLEDCLHILESPRNRSKIEKKNEEKSDKKTAKKADKKV
ncbi:type I DNA topoisomerase [Candidatus Cytomitobacter indipagum]|uniref:DNA topoisomerase 1 n=1 Tax=Candidatus Cytomitobacter indipagum TaxID=2601575 RepID=A0A5C0UE25_9PROT|nr:type I DNA topoisomerase [Candidatus Cytomitobacter indipagum]QEK38019.1 type I DNA topoisomerase [Candidatus Cytomitobacter indipagum]